MTTTLTPPAVRICQGADYSWGPHDGCREFMTEPEEWTCGDPAEVLLAVDYDAEIMPYVRGYEGGENEPQHEIVGYCLRHYGELAPTVEGTEPPMCYEDAHTHYTVVGVR